MNTTTSSSQQKQSLATTKESTCKHARRRARLKAAGFVAVTEWVPPDQKYNVQTACRFLREHKNYQLRVASHKETGRLKSIEDE